MPARSPFTVLVRQTARRTASSRADLHLHSTHSDGTYTPGQLVDLARRSGLAAISLTDHDTLSGVEEVRAAAGTGLEIVSGVEITCEYSAREIHLLGYFVRTEDGPLTRALQRLCEHRSQRFWHMVERLRGRGVCLDEDEVRSCAATGSLGRRHLAELLVRGRWAGTVREAFVRYLGDGGRVQVPKLRLPISEALALVVGAGGVASWAHPSYDCTRETLLELRRLGLGAVEVYYPGTRRSASASCVAGPAS